MKITPILLLLGAVLTFFTPQFSIAQTDLALLHNLAEHNHKSVEALVLYPSETRLAILESTKHPEVLIKMQDMRDKTSAAFRTLIEDLPRATQAVFYDLNRYPGLTESLVIQSNNPVALRKMLEALPSDKQEEAFVQNPSRRKPIQNPPTPKTEKPAQREPAPAQRPRTQPSEAKDYHRQNWEEKKHPQKYRATTQLQRPLSRQEQPPPMPQKAGETNNTL